MWLWELWVSISLTRCDLKHLLCRGGREELSHFQKGLTPPGFHSYS